MSDNKGRSVLITGSAHGIGSGLAIGFAKAGYSYIGINYARDKEGAEQTAQTCRDLGAEVIVIKADVRVCEECERLVNEFAEFAGGIDVLINNAGGGGIHPKEPFEEMPLEYWEDQLHLNMFAAMYCSRFAIRVMKRGGKGGRIINISSQLSYMCQVNRKLLPYNCAKGGLNSFTMALANEMAPQGIIVNAIAPGLIITPTTMMRYTEEQKAEQLRHIPAGFLGQPEDIAVVALFLADPALRYMVGQTLLVDGGQLTDGVQ